MEREPKTGPNADHEDMAAEFRSSRALFDTLKLPVKWLLLIGLLIALVYPIPAAMLSRGRRQISECHTEVEAGGRNPSECESGLAWLFWPSIMPFHAAETAQSKYVYENERMHLELAWANRAVPNRAALEPLLDRLISWEVDHESAPDVPADLFQAFRVGDDFLNGGGLTYFERLAEDGRYRLATELAAALGDVEAVDRLLQEATAAGVEFAGSGQAILLQCVRGQTPDEGNPIWDTPSSSGADPFRHVLWHRPLVPLVCQPGQVEPLDTENLSNLAPIILTAAWERGALPPPTDGLFFEPRAWLGRLAVLAYRLDTESLTEAEVLALAGLVTPRAEDVVRSPWQTAADTRRVTVIDKDRYQRAAETLLTAFEQPSNDDETPTENLSDLRSAAHLLLTEAAFGAAMRQDSETALELVERAEALAETSLRRAYTAPARYLADDREGAIALLRSAAEAPEYESYTRDEKVLLHDFLAQALAAIGEYEEAETQIELLLDEFLTSRGSASCRSRHNTIMATWWEASLVAYLNGRFDELRDECPNVFNGIWVDTLGGSEAEQRAARMNMTVSNWVTGELPAMMHLSHQTLPPEADVELFLDTVFGEAHRSNPILLGLARAEAAWRRGDLESEALWRQRVAGIYALAGDNPARRALLELAVLSGSGTIPED